MKKLLILFIFGISLVTVEAKDISDRDMLDSFIRSNVNIKCELDVIGLWRAGLLCPYCKIDDLWLDVEVDNYMKVCIIEGTREGSKK